MSKKLLIFIVLIGICTCCFFLFGETGNIWSEEDRTGSAVERPIFISDTAMFKELERPPVEFYHDRHTVALEKEGCGACHPQDEKGRFIFKYPKGRDDKTEQGLMNSYHDSCIGCHNEISKAGKKSGFITCGECHVVRKKSQEMEYLPIGPDYYHALKDTYHRDCIACHKEGKSLTKEAKVLDWKDFYVKEKEIEKATWPKIGFDYYLHYQHEKGLEKKCEFCHHIYNEEEKKLVYKKETESSCRDCHREKDEEKRRSFRKVAHTDCINCHIGRKKEGKKAGPFACAKCHTEQKQRTSEEMAGVPRQNRKQPEKVLIKTEETRMREVPFDHKAHEGYTRSCRTCHHETLNACKKCHTLKGSKEGGKVTLAEAYHKVSSEWSCIGCHESKKSEPLCAGCHHLMKSGLTNTSCLLCHSGVIDKAKGTLKLGTADELLPEKISEEISINVIEKDYMPAKFPHLRIIKKLTDISNASKLAKHFHSDQMVICSGCHHESPVEAGKPVPLCSTCHSQGMESRRTDVPGLLGAYHRQCLGCHKEMEIEPTGCTGCHAEKAGQQTEVGKQ